VYQLQLFFHVRTATRPAITGMALCHKNVGGQWSNAWKVWETLSMFQDCVYVCILPDDESVTLFRNLVCF